MTTASTHADARSAGPTIIACSLVSFMVGLDALVVTTVLPQIRVHFSAGQGLLSWAVNAYALAFAVAILVGSALGDRFGRRNIYLDAVIVFAIASACCALSPTFGWFILARAVQGAAAGIAAPLALTILTIAFPPERRGRILGIWGAITGLAVAAGPLVGGAIAHGFSWQWVFWLNLPVGVLVVVLSLRIQRDGPRARRIDVLGLATVTIGTVLLVHALVRVRPDNLTDASIWVEGAAGVAVLAAFAFWQTRTATPVVPPVLFRSPGFTAASLATAALGAGLYGAAYLLSQYIAATITHDPLNIGLALLPWTGLAIIIAPLAGRLSDRTGEGPLLAAGLALQGLGALLITMFGGTNYLSLLGPLIISGIGISVAFPTSATALMRHTTPELAGAASGVGNAFRQVGAAIGVAVAIAAFSFAGGFTTPAQAQTGLHTATLTLAVIGGLGAIAAATISRRAKAAARSKSHDARQRTTHA
ncbi:MFS transporter [Microbacterium gorillae]|uniref:MFS transporter n=1 Tax=Microbacterium gorillae TaxID=1231063 RepID=UPI00058ED770|nr:MFS transporter [Microbacterium gorillae]